MSEDESLSHLEREYEGTKVVSIVFRDGEVPRVEWSEGATENDVIATLFKALLFMTVDDFLQDMFEDMLEGDDDDV